MYLAAEHVRVGRSIVVVHSRARPIPTFERVRVVVPRIYPFPTISPLEIPYSFNSKLLTVFPVFYKGMGYTIALFLRQIYSS